MKDYCREHASRKLRYVPPSLGEELDLLHRVFIMYDNDKKKRLSLNEVRYLDHSPEKSPFGYSRQN